MSLAAIVLLAVQAAQPAPGPASGKAPQAPAAQSAGVSATASVRIIRPAVISFDLPIQSSVKAQDARAQVHRDKAGTVWAQFQ